MTVYKFTYAFLIWTYGFRIIFHFFGFDATERGLLVIAVANVNAVRPLWEVWCYFTPSELISSVGVTSPLVNYKVHSCKGFM